MATPTTSGASTTVSLSPYYNLNSLLSTQKWASSTITYSIPTAASSWSTDRSVGYGPTSGVGEPWSADVAYLNSTETLRFKSALQKWANVANVNFVETADSQFVVGDIRVAYTYTPDMVGAAAYAFLPYGEPSSGDIWINSKGGTFRTAYLDGTRAYQTLIHELGHALGLKHPFETSTANSGVIQAQNDTKVLTVMSYSGEPGRSDTGLSFYPTTPMLYDIEAIQYMYGANRSFNVGDTTYSYNDSKTYLETIWDGGGNNTIAYSGSKASLINLNEGSGSSIGNDVYTTDANGKFINYVENVWIAFDTKIQNAIGGSGDNILIGNDLGNSLTAGAGKDLILGGSGNDTILAGAGDDRAEGGGGDDNFLGLVGKDSYFGGSGNNALTVSMSSSQLHLNKLRTNSFFIRDDAGDMAIIRDVQNVRASDKTIALSTLGIYGNAQLDVIDIYVAAFRRAPETSGYNYWANEKSSKGLISVADTIFSLDIVKSIYPTNASATDFVTAIYQNVFNKAPDTTGLNYWTQQLAAKSRGQLVIDMTTAALGVADGVEGKDFFQNRVDWAQYAVGYQAAKQTEISVTHLTDLTAGITADAMTLIKLIGSAETGTVI